MACWWRGREAPFLPQNLSPVKVAAVHLPRCTQPVEEGLRANGGASFSFRNACCCLLSVRGELCALPTHSGSSMVYINSCCQSEVHVAALHHERWQYCSSAKFDFAGAESCFNKSEIIFKIVPGHAMEQRLGRGLYILMTYCHWNALCLQCGEELSYLGFQTNWMWVLATSVEYSHGAVGGCASRPVWRQVAEQQLFPQPSVWLYYHSFVLELLVCMFFPLKLQHGCCFESLWCSNWLLGLSKL